MRLVHAPTIKAVLSSWLSRTWEDGHVYEYSCLPRHLIYRTLILAFLDCKTELASIIHYKLHILYTIAEVHNMFQYWYYPNILLNCLQAWNKQTNKKQMLNIIQTSWLLNFFNLVHEYLLEKYINTMSKTVLSKHLYNIIMNVKINMGNFILRRELVWNATEFICYLSSSIKQ